MNFNKFTNKAQEAIQEAVGIAQSYGQQVIEPAHIMGGVLKSGEQIISFLLQKSGCNINKVKSEVNNLIASLPKVSGGDPYFSRESNKVLNKAEEIAKRYGDEFVSIEPMLLAIAETENPVAKILNSNGANRNELEKAIKELRQGESVKSQSAEDNY